MEQEEFPEPEHPRESWETPTVEELPVEETSGGNGLSGETWTSHIAS